MLDTVVKLLLCECSPCCKSCFCSVTACFTCLVFYVSTVDLLQNTSQLVDNLLDFSDELLKKWADINLVNAVCEALKQMRCVIKSQNFLNQGFLKDLKLELENEK